MKWDELPGAFEWDRKLAYYLDPDNQKNVSKEDLQEALSILTAKYCDEFFNLRFLECFIEEQLGTAKLESAIEASVGSDAVPDRGAVIMNEKTVDGKMRAALDFLNRIAEEFGDPDVEDF